MEKKEEFLSKEELIEHNKKFKEGLKKRLVYLKKTKEILNSHKNILYVLMHIDDINMTKDGQPIYPLNNLVHNISVRCPDIASIPLVKMALDVCENTIADMKENSNGMKKRFLKLNKEYYRLDKLRTHLKKLNDAADAGEDVILPMADIISYLQLSRPQSTKYMVDQLYNICNLCADETEAAIKNYEGLKL